MDGEFEEVGWECDQGTGEVFHFVTSLLGVVEKGVWNTRDGPARSTAKQEGIKMEEAWKRAMAAIEYTRDGNERRCKYFRRPYGVIGLNTRKEVRNANGTREC